MSFETRASRLYQKALNEVKGEAARTLLRLCMIETKGEIVKRKEVETKLKRANMEIERLQAQMTLYDQLELKKYPAYPVKRVIEGVG